MTEGQISVGSLSVLRRGHGIWPVIFMVGRAILDGRRRKMRGHSGETIEPFEGNPRGIFKVRGMP